MSDEMTIADLIAGLDDAVAISAPDRPSLTYAGLRTLAQEVAAALAGFGIERTDRVAIVLPNGPEMAAAFVTLATCSATAPLNPAYKADEFEFYLDDLDARAVVVEHGSTNAVVEVARSRGVEVLELERSADDRAGAFTLSGSAGSAAASSSRAASDDVALILHTSGTTSRPKMVPLSHANICASAGNISATLSLTADDRCMNVMPLFHIHGLVAAVLAPLASGGSVYCTPGFDALRFFAWLDDAGPTWYTAVPTMHQAILARAPRNQAVVESAKLRFIRSSSASLPPQVMRGLEDAFDSPVVEAYAMTEAAHQMCCNPLPPAARKPGCVGPAAGPEVAIMDAAGSLLEQGLEGEIVIRGANVTQGYMNNPTANADAFSADGWFRTGDQGVMDEDHYVKVTGRLKEIINRGGEKIAPLEIDEVLLDHPSVQQVCTFAMPHRSLGEEVAAAVVLAEGAEGDEAALKDFAGERLADFKVPRRFVFLDEIPKGATGKIQRIGMAERLGLGS